MQLYRLAEWAITYWNAHSEQISREVLQRGAGALQVALGLVVRGGFVVFGAFLTLFFFYFISVSWARVLVFLRNLVPVVHRERAIGLAGEMDGVIAAFVRGRLIICGFSMVYFTIAYWLIGVPIPLALGPIVGVLSIVPYANTLLIPPAILLGFMQPGIFAFQSAWWWIVAAPIVVHFVAQSLDDYVLTPRIQGKSTGMGMPTILFASLAGATLAGFYGVLVSLPVAACIKIALRELFWPRFRAWAEGRASDPLPVGKGACDRSDAPTSSS